MSSATVVIGLPREYKGIGIEWRYPYMMYGELVVDPSTPNFAFPQGTFYHAQDLPFEVTRMVPFVTTLDADGDPQANPSATWPDVGPIFANVLLNIKLIGAGRDMTFVNTRISAMLEKDSLIYQFDEPLVLEARQGFQVSVSNEIASDLAAGGIRMEIAFHGSLLQLAKR